MCSVLVNLINAQDVAREYVLITVLIKSKYFLIYLKLNGIMFHVNGKKTFLPLNRQVSNNYRGKRTFDINLTAILAFRELRNRHSGLATFCGY